MKLFQDLAQSVQLYLFNSSKEFKKRNLPIDMGDMLINARQVLVLLPVESVVAKTELGMINKLQSSFPNWTITIVTRESNASNLQHIKQSLITFSDDDLSKAGKPKKAFLERSFKGSFDVAVDLSLPYSYTNLVLMWLSSAKVRVGFHHEKREPFYNFLVRHKDGAASEHSYLSLVNYLQAFI